jgi:CubicO group peptidase (beta-lactamase class C family)
MLDESANGLHALRLERLVRRGQVPLLSPFGFPCYTRIFRRREGQDVQENDVRSLCNKRRVTSLCVAIWGFTIGVFAAAPAFAQSAGDDSKTRAILERVAADVPEAIISQRSPRQSLTDRMARDKIPAVSVAVFRDGKLAWAQAWGVADAQTGVAATPATLFQAASISKPVTALAAMKLVSDGTLSLDADVSKAINGWQADAPITLRQLLSHSAGLNVSGFAGYEAGKAVPTPLQILNGDAPANSPRVRIESQPGTAFNYSGGGLTVVQLLMSQRRVAPFADIMRDTVLTPLGMTESQFAQPLPTDWVARAASGHQNGAVIPGRAHVYPELAAAGLWTTPRDLGKVALDIQEALGGRVANVATPDIARQMLTPQIGGYGLGFALESRAGEALFRHSGLNEGFETNLVASAAASGPRMVVAVMTNGQGGTMIANALLRAIAREYQWAAYAPRRVREVSLTQKQREQVSGYYRSNARQIAVESVAAGLELRDGGWMRAPMMPLSSTRFAVSNRTLDLRFAEARAGLPASVIMIEGGKEERLVKVENLFAALNGKPALVRGTMNDWGDQSALTQGADGLRSLAQDLQPGVYEFKIASGDWDALNLGSPLGSEGIKVGVDIPLVAMGGNVSLLIAQAGRYIFSVDARDPRRPILRVTFASK